MFGGGARGFAHLGVWRGLRARGVEINCVGGTSIGGIMAALVAADPSCERAIDITRRAFGENPTGDFNLLPLISLIKGDRVREAIERALSELTGSPIDIENLWKSYFCVATNYSQATEQMLVRGKRRYRLPSLTSYLMNITILYSIPRQKEARAVTDLYFNPPLFKAGLLEWKRFDSILRQGEQHATEVLDALTPAQRKVLGMRD